MESLHVLGQPRPGLEYERSESDTMRKYVLTFDDGSQVSFSDFRDIRRGGLRHDVNASVLRGCNMGCENICVSANDFKGLLTAEQIVAQPLAAFDARLLPEGTTRVVGFLGEGEPARNQDNVIEALKLLRRRRPDVHHVLLSTTGFQYKSFLGELTRLAKEIGDPGWLRLQFSLFHMDNAVRKEHIPRTAPWDDMIPMLDAFAGAAQAPVKYNVPMIRGLTDTQEHLRDLGWFSAENPDCRRIKLSSFNPLPASPLVPVDDKKIHEHVVWPYREGANMKAFIADHDLVGVNCGHVSGLLKKTMEGQ